MTRLAWRWRRWRARHYLHVAAMAWDRCPTEQAWDVMARAYLHATQVDLDRP